MVALKSLALSLSKISPEFLIDQNRFLPDLSYTFSQYFFTFTFFFADVLCFFSRARSTPGEGGTGKYRPP